MSSHLLQQAQQRRLKTALTITVLASLGLASCTVSASEDGIVRAIDVADAPP